MADNVFQALVANKTDKGISVQVQNFCMEDLPEGEVTIQVAYSSVNYKDGLVCHPSGRVAKSYPLIPGIDLAGTVVESKDERYKFGDEVLVTGYGLGVSHSGGFSEYARVPAEWIVPVPDGLTLEECMIIGTAGFTAALSLYKLQLNGLAPNQGPVLVTGASGGVGSMAVAILSALGYEVHASSGKPEERGFLLSLGAKEILNRDEWYTEAGKPLGKEKWAAVVDPVGGQTLANALKALRYGGSAASSGLTGGAELASTVYPFILRGINLLGIDSVLCPMDVRRKVWQLLSNEWKPSVHLKSLSNEVSLQNLPGALADILDGKIRGRTLLKL